MLNNGKLKKQKQCKTYKQQKNYLKWTSKPSYISQKIFGNDLAAIRKNKVTLTPNIYWNVRVRINKVLMYEFHYDYVKNMATTEDYYAQTLKV